MALKPWWTRASVEAFLGDLIQAELARAGMRALCPPASDLDLETLGLGSLAFIDLATTVAVQFRLDATGHDARLMGSRRLDEWVELVLESRAQQDETIGFLSSGSTDQPRLYWHRMALLEQEIAFFAGLLAGRQRILRAVPCHHIYGFLFALMLPAALGVQCLDVRQNLPSAVLRQTRPGDLLVGHPSFFELATRLPLNLAEDVTLITSTAPCPPELWQRLAGTGCARIIEVYGSSETAGVGWRDGPDRPFELLPYWSRDPMTEIGIRRLDDGGQWVAYELPDRILWADERHFQVLGRRDGAVQIGGLNVYPERVAACLREHPEVAEAAVRPTGSGADLQLKAFVVPAATCRDPEGLPDRLHRWLAGRLLPHERPRSIRVGPKLPRSELGKLADWEE